MYTYLMQGGSVPEPYVDVILRREHQLAPLRREEMTVGDELDILACLQGEGLAQRARAAMGGG